MNHLSSLQPYLESKREPPDLEAADEIAREYGVSREQIIRDAVFAEALDRVACLCGDHIRQEVLSGGLKWTRRDVARLADLENEDLKETVQTALNSGTRPVFPKRKSGTFKTVKFPLHDAREQVRVLEEILDSEELRKLRDALARWLNSNADDCSVSASNR